MKTIPDLIKTRLGLPDDAGTIARWRATELRKRPLLTLRNLASDVVRGVLEDK